MALLWVGFLALCVLSGWDIANAAAAEGWVPVETGVKIDYDMEHAPLEIKTDSELNSGEYVYVYFYTSGGHTAGGVYLKFSSTVKYYLYWCSYSWVTFPSDLPSATNKVWKITVNKSSGIRLVIHCNMVEVVNVLLSDTECTGKSDWSTIWNRDTAQIKFLSSDTASDYYRPDLTADCRKPTIQDGKVSPDSSTISSGSTYEVTCSDGFTISGSSTITCTEGKLSALPTCKPAVNTVACDGDEMTLSLAEKGNYAYIHLLEKGAGCEFEGDETTITTKIHECGTKVNINNTHIIYQNKITATTSEEDYNNGITRGDLLEITFQCAYERTGKTGVASWQTKGETVVESVKGQGSLTFQLHMYKTEEFAEKVLNDDYPLELTPKDYLFMQVLVDSPDPDISLGLVQLQAKDTPNEEGGNYVYDLVKDGCTKDSTLKFIETDKSTLQAVDPKKRRFSFQAFQFLKSESAVYVHAVVKVCGESGDSCKNICQEKKRKRRSVDAASETNQYHVFQGPLIPADPAQMNGVTAQNKEQLTGTEATISCTVSGLTKALNGVKWKNSDGTDVTTGVTGYTSVAGTFGGDSQTATLTVAGAQNDQDATYNCLVTSTEHGETDKSTTVNLKVFTVTSIPKSVTTAIDQTLTCTIRNLDASKPVIVTWKESGDGVVSEDDNYDLSSGTVDGSGVQAAVLTIKTVKLATFTSPSSVNYMCSVNSSQYTDSPDSADVDVVANVLKLGVTAQNKEQLTGTEATISCTVSGLTKALNGVKWKKSDGTDVTTGVTGYTSVAGTFGGYSQTTTLTVAGAQNDQDATYNCLVTSTEHGETDKSATVNLKVFTVTSTPKSITTAIDQTLTCTIRNLDASKPVIVTWKESGGGVVSEDDNYDLSSGTVDGSGVQAAVLTIKTAKLARFTIPSSVTYKCSVKSSQYTDSPDSADVDVVANVLKLVDGGWTDFGNWTDCSKDCANGTQARTRSCTNPTPEHGGSNCTGSDTETRNCNTHLCPISETIAIIGGGVGGGVLLIIIAVVVVCIIKRVRVGRKDNRKVELECSEIPGPSAGPQGASVPVPVLKRIAGTDSGYRIRKYKLSLFDLNAKDGDVRGAWCDSGSIKLKVDNRIYGSGGFRKVFQATDESTGKKYVVKRYHQHIKDHIVDNLGKQIDEHARIDAQKTGIASYYANKFSADSGHKLEYVPVYMSQDSEPVFIEEFVDSEKDSFKKYIGNEGQLQPVIDKPPPPPKEQEVCEAFVHYTLHKSNRELMVCDVQGWFPLLCDPEIASLIGGNIVSTGTAGNHNKNAIDKFSNTHKCSLICQNLGL